MSKPQYTNEQLFNAFIEPTGLNYTERLGLTHTVFRADAEMKNNWEVLLHPNSTYLPDHSLIKDKNTEGAFQLNLKPEMGNFFGALHGGCVGTIVDVYTSMAIMASEDPIGVSVSVTMSVDYIKSIKINTKIYVKTKINKFGKRLVFSSCEIYDEKMDLCYTATHTKMRMDFNQLVGGKEKL